MVAGSPEQPRKGCEEGEIKTLIGSLCAVAAFTLVTSGAVAKDAVGNEVLPFEFDNPSVYIECVGEIVNGHVVGETRYHEFELLLGLASAILENATELH